MVQLGTDTAVVLRVKAGPDCSAVIPRLKESLLGGKDSSVDLTSLRDVSLDRHPGLEYKHKTYSNTILDRWYCVGGHLYAFSVSWPTAQSFPAAATRILDSIRFPVPNAKP